MRKWAKGAGWGACALTILATGGIVAGAAGFLVAGFLLVYAIPIWGFTRNQRRLTKKGSELAKSVGDVEKLIDRDAEAFREVFAALIPWRMESKVPAGPIPAQPSTPLAPRVIEPANNGRSTGRQAFWRALTVAEQNALTAVARERTFAPGTVLWREGQPAGHVVVIRTGWVCVEHPDGERIIAWRGPGDVVGERAALRPGSRSATVIAVEKLEAYEIATEAFAAFLGEHPRLLDVLEGQIYGRLTEDRLTKDRDGELTPSPLWTGQNCSILFTDIAQFAAHHRSDRDRRTMRRVMYRILQEALEGSGVPWTDCHRDDRGDGVLLVVPPSTPTSSVVDALLTHLAVGLLWHNRQSGDATRIQLRAALDVGPVVSDPEGVSGQAIIHAARLLESPILKRQLADSAADLGVIVSTYVYDNVIAHESGPAGYQQVRFRVKESRMTAWMRLAGQAQLLGLTPS